MKVFLVILTLALSFSISTSPAATPTTQPATAPAPADFLRYERLSPLYKSKSLPKPQIDALLLALQNGAMLDENWQPLSPARGTFGSFTCILPPSPRLQISAIRPDNSRFSIAFTAQGDGVYLDNDLYAVKPPAIPAIQKILAALEADLRTEILAAPRPCTYQVSTLQDGGTLSGIARIFYNDPTQWKRIYNANRKTIKDPNLINPDMKLTIP